MIIERLSLSTSTSDFQQHVVTKQIEFHSIRGYHSKKKNGSLDHQIATVLFEK